MWLNNHFICKWFVCASKFHSYHYTCKWFICASKLHSYHYTCKWFSCASKLHSYHYKCKWFVCASKFHSYHYTCKRLVWLVHRHDERIQKTSSRVHGLMEDADWRTVYMVETFIYGLIIFISYTLGDFIWVLPGIKYNLWPWLSEWGSEHTLSLKR